VSAHACTRRHGFVSVRAREQRRHATIVNSGEGDRMPLDPQNTAQIRDRELRVWDLLLKGLEGVEIARREGVDPAVISRIKKRVERRITADTNGKAESLKARQLGEIRRARREA